LQRKFRKSLANEKSIVYFYGDEKRKEQQSLVASGLT